MPGLRILAAACLLAATLSAERVTVTLLATTDLHGNIYPVDYFTSRPVNRGLATIATLIKAARRENPNTLLIDCGDTIQGSPVESVWQQYVQDGRLPPGLRFVEPLRQDPLMLVMNTLGYKAMVLGNHEFNFGLKNLDRARSEARFPWLSANTAAAGRARPFDPYLVDSLGGVKIAVIGVTTTSIPAWEPPDHYQGYRFLDARQAVESALAELRRRHAPDLVVVGVHDDDRVAVEIAEQVSGIDAVVFGHTHQSLAGRRIGGALVVQPRHWGMSLARIDFTLDRKSRAGWNVVHKSSRLVPVSAQTAADPEVLALARPHHELTERYLNTPVARAETEMDGRLGRIQDTPLVDAVHEVQMHYARADVSFTALFNPRVRIRRGAVTVRDIAALYVYDNDLYAIEGDGRMVKEALENAGRFFRSCPDAACSQGPLINRGIPGFNFDMAQGVQYEIDLTRRAGDRIVNLRRNGRPLRPDEKLRIAVNNYRAGGSGGYDMFRRARVVWKSPQDVRTLMIEYFSLRRKLPAKADDNWRIIPPQAVRLLFSEAAPGID